MSLDSPKSVNLMCPSFDISILSGLMSLERENNRFIRLQGITLKYVNLKDWKSFYLTLLLAGFLGVEVEREGAFRPAPF